MSKLLWVITWSGILLSADLLLCNYLHVPIKTVVLSSGVGWLLAQISTESYSK
jgi:hypothetical protein